MPAAEAAVQEVVLVTSEVEVAEPAVVKVGSDHMSMLINYLVNQMHGNRVVREALQVYLVVMEVNGETYLLLQP